MRRQTLGMAKFLMSQSAIDLPSPSFGIINSDDETAAMTEVDYILPSVRLDARRVMHGEARFARKAEALPSFPSPLISSLSSLSLTTKTFVAVSLSFQLYS